MKIRGNKLTQRIEQAGVTPEQLAQGIIETGMPVDDGAAGHPQLDGRSRPPALQG